MRISIFGLFFYIILGYDFAQFLYAPILATCQTPMGVWWQIDLSPYQAMILKQVLAGALLFGAVGFLTPIALWTGFFCHLGLSLSILKHCYFDHSQVPITAVLLLWALVDKSSGLRADNLLWPRLFSRDDNAGLSLLVLRIYFCLIFFAAGFTKLRMGGLDWIFSDSLWNMVVMQNFLFENSPYRRLFWVANQWLISYPLLCKAIAADVVAGELLTPLAILGPRFARPIVFHLLMMMSGFVIFFFVFFKAWFVLFILWLNFAEIEHWFRRSWIKPVLMSGINK